MRHLDRRIFFSSVVFPGLELGSSQDSMIQRFMGEWLSVQHVTKRKGNKACTGGISTPDLLRTCDGPQPFSYSGRRISRWSWSCRG